MENYTQIGYLTINEDTEYWYMNFVDMNMVPIDGGQFIKLEQETRLESPVRMEKYLETYRLLDGESQYTVWDKNL